jgi:Cytochrome c oxidase subunit III/LAGLIDADG endonuclease
MKNININQYQFFPFHLVTPSPWPILVSFSLLTTTLGAVSYFHGYLFGGSILTLGFILTASGMGLWLKDVTTEATLLSNFINFLKIKNKSIAFIKNKFNNFNLSNILNTFFYTICFVLFKTNLNCLINNPKLSIPILEISQNYTREELGYYLAGLLEGDGSIHIPALGKTTLNRILNPRFVFTFHKNELPFYKKIQLELKGIGRFENRADNVARYIIGDIEGIKTLIILLHNKLRTPKNITFNKLILFMNAKYDLNFKESSLDTSNINSNSWFSGFTSADGHFGIKINDFKPKSETRKRSKSASVNLVFRLDQRSYDKPTSSSMFHIMEKISNFLSCNLITINVSPT